MMRFDFEQPRQSIMINDDVKSKTLKRKPGKRKFFKVMPGVGDGALGYVLENWRVLALPGRYSPGPPIGRRGFIEHSETPRFLFDKTRGRQPRDFEIYGVYWLVSDRMKAVLQAVDPAGCAFIACVVRFPTGDDGPV